MIKKKKNGDWKKRQIVWVFWNDDHISEPCEKWIYYDGNYAYTRFAELHTRSGEVVFTREHKATTSKDKSNIYIDIDEQQMFKDFYTKDKVTTKTKTKTEDKNKATTKTKTKTDDKNKATTKTKTKTEDKNKTTLKTKTKTKAKNMTKTGDKKILDKINNKIDTINKLNEGLVKIKADVTKKVEFIYESMCELQDEIYSGDSWLRLVELDKIDAIIEEAFNIVWKVLYKNKKYNKSRKDYDR